ncbi:hypothetical protein LOZ58_005440 [Ophidiomyces ophidiicola]|nr:hypothetical protein LOZ58_005440 [Ophidiomyces ophidiicola]
MRSVARTLVASFFALRSVNGFWDHDGESTSQATPTGAGHSPRVLQSDTSTTSSDVSPSATCSGTLFYSGYLPQLIYTTVTSTSTITGFQPMRMLEPTYITPLPPCASYDCSLGFRHEDSCRQLSLPVFAPLNSLISVTKKTTIYQAPVSVTPPVFSGLGQVRNTRLPMETITVPSAPEFAHWIESAIFGQINLSSSHSDSNGPAPEPTRRPDQNDEARLQGRPTDSGGEDPQLKPASTTVLTLAGIPVTIRGGQVTTIIYGDPPMTQAISGQATLTLTAANSGRTVEFIVSPSAIIHGGDTFPLNLPVPSTIATATRAISDGSQTHLTSSPEATSVQRDQTNTGSIRGSGIAETGGASHTSSAPGMKNSATSSKIPVLLCVLVFAPLASVLTLT